MPAFYNPGDHYLAVLAPNKLMADGSPTYARVCNHYDRSEDKKRIVRVVTNIREKPSLLQDVSDSFSYYSSYCEQMKVLIYRNILTLVREPMICRARMFQNVFIALVLGAIYFGQEMTQQGIMNINGALYVFLINITFANNFLVINVFCSELPLLIREYSSGLYHVSAYYISKMIAEVSCYEMFFFRRLELRSSYFSCQCSYSTL